MNKLEIVSPVLQRLYRDWRSRLHGRAMPARRDFDVLDLKYVLGDLNLIDVEHAPLRFRFRVHSTNAVRWVGTDLTGKTIEDYPDPDYRKMAREHCTAVVETRLPQRIFRDRFPLNYELLRWEAVILPLSDDGSLVNMLMVGFNLSPVRTD